MIKTIYFVFFICAFSLGLWACTGKDSDKFKNLSSDQFEEMIQDKTIQLVDVRTVAEYSEGHIPGSININAVELLHDVHMIGHLEIRHKRLAEALDLDVLAVVLADRHARIDNLRNDLHALLDFSILLFLS